MKSLITGHTCGEKLLKELKELQKGKDPEREHQSADKALLGYINDKAVTKEFNKVTRWYG